MYNCFRRADLAANDGFVGGTCPTPSQFSLLKDLAMPLKLNGLCRGKIRFSADSHAPVPFMRCYCSICRKTRVAADTQSIFTPIRLMNERRATADYPLVIGMTGMLTNASCLRQRGVDLAKSRLRKPVDQLSALHNQIPAVIMTAQPKAATISMPQPLPCIGRTRI